MKQFENNADWYQRIRSKIRYPEYLYEYITKHCNTKTAALDIGCGNGVSTAPLKNYFEYVEGHDLGENLIRLAKETNPNITFRTCFAEHLSSDLKFSLVTSATSFYWMNREIVLQKIADLLLSDGVFCAYKYDFPIVYGPIRKVIDLELATKWNAYRDPRLTHYDDTLEIIRDSNRFKTTELFLLPNTIQLTPKEVALFFLSTSYVTKYIELEGGAGYAEEFVDKICNVDSSELAYVSFDIRAFLAKGIR
jgi:SAM-dependent methyltransferase